MPLEELDMQIERGLCEDSPLAKIALYPLIPILPVGMHEPFSRAFLSASMSGIQYLEEEEAFHYSCAVHTQCQTVSGGHFNAKVSVQVFVVADGGWAARLTTITPEGPTVPCMYAAPSSVLAASPETGRAGMSDQEIMNLAHELVDLP